MPKNSQKVSDFEDYLKTNLSAKEYEVITEKMSLSSHRWTRILKNPQLMTVKEVEMIADILGKNPYELIQNFNLGYKVITLSQMATIENNYKHNG